MGHIQKSQKLSVTMMNKNAKNRVGLKILWHFGRGLANDHPYNIYYRNKNLLNFRFHHWLYQRKLIRNHPASNSKIFWKFSFFYQNWPDFGQVSPLSTALSIFAEVLYRMWIFKFIVLRNMKCWNRSIKTWTWKDGTSLLKFINELSTLRNVFYIT